MPPNIKRVLKEITPPILLRLRPSHALPVYTSFDQALADSDSYEDANVIEVVSKKTQLFAASLNEQGNVIADRQTSQNLFALAHVHPEKALEVVELGGACGATYSSLKAFLPERIQRWHIVETPAMAEAGKKLLQNTPLQFSTDLNAAAQSARRDLLWAQGVLQYMRDPVRVWHDLFQLNFDFVYVTRVLVGIDIAQPIITKQVVRLSEHGPGAMPAGLIDRITSQPLTIVPAEVFRAPTNYRVAFSFIESTETAMRIGDRHITTRNMGWLLQKIHE